MNECKHGYNIYCAECSKDKSQYTQSQVDDLLKQCPNKDELISALNCLVEYNDCNGTLISKDDVIQLIERVL